MKFGYPPISNYENDPWRQERLRVAAYLLNQNMGDLFEKVCSLHDDKGDLRVETWHDGGRDLEFEQHLIDVWQMLNESCVYVLYRDAKKPEWLMAEGLPPGGDDEISSAAAPLPYGAPA